ncbi:MAG TPA: polyprenyl synthetase family protein [Catalimonadaceae bacterium]|nr:polyprenyl synthetase family protein [Catalimonadaceae bacterium]HPI10013.1 polyprenyl synthetase family protein [Catalimonadaceae bacterium]
MQYQLTQFLPLIEEAIHSLDIPSAPASLYDPIRYFMDLPGKRIRPVFALQCLELFRKPNLKDAKAALSIELFHNFSLVHDDIMDKADVRRGFPTVHVKWNEPTALLSGDALLVLAYDALLEAETVEFRLLLKRFNETALAVCEGQQLDMDFSTVPIVEMEEYQEMIDRKTAALIAFSFELGGFLGGVAENERKALHDFGMAMGRCFQLRDDHLDLFGDEARTGKKRGGDIGNSKLTFPVLTSFGHPDSETFKALWLEKTSDPEHRISRILTWMEEKDIPKLSEEKMHSEMEAGMALLYQVSGDTEVKSRISDMCHQLAFRDK